MGGGINYRNGRSSKKRDLRRANACHRDHFGPSFHERSVKRLAYEGNNSCGIVTERDRWDTERVVDAIRRGVVVVVGPALDLMLGREMRRIRMMKRRGAVPDRWQQELINIAERYQVGKNLMNREGVHENADNCFTRKQMKPFLHCRVYVSPGNTNCITVFVSDSWKSYLFDEDLERFTGKSVGNALDVWASLIRYANEKNLSLIEDEEYVYNDDYLRSLYGVGKFYLKRSFAMRNLKCRVSLPDNRASRNLIARYYCNRVKTAVHAYSTHWSVKERGKLPELNVQFFSQHIAVSNFSANMKLEMFELRPRDLHACGSNVIAEI